MLNGLKLRWQPLRQLGDYNPEVKNLHGVYLIAHPFGIVYYVGQGHIQERLHAHHNRFVEHWPLFYTCASVKDEYQLGVEHYLHQKLCPIYSDSAGGKWSGIKVNLPFSQVQSQSRCYTGTKTMANLYRVSYPKSPKRIWGSLTTFRSCYRFLTTIRLQVGDRIELEWEPAMRTVLSIEKLPEPFEQLVPYIHCYILSGSSLNQMGDFKSSFPTIRW